MTWWRSLHATSTRRALLFAARTQNWAEAHLTDRWANVMEHGEYSTPHCHYDAEIAVVYAFDIDPTAQRVLRRTVRLNGVKNVRVRGRLDTRALQDLLVHGAFVFSDCEGFEIELLDPIKVPMLRTATLIVELHDMIDPRCSSTINRWFRESHLVTIIDEAPKTARGRAQLDAEVRDLALAARAVLAGAGLALVGGAFRRAPQVLADTARNLVLRLKALAHGGFP